MARLLPHLATFMIAPVYPTTQMYIYKSAFAREVRDHPGTDRRSGSRAEEPRLTSAFDPLRTFAKAHFSGLPHLLLMPLTLIAVITDRSSNRRRAYDWIEPGLRRWRGRR